MATVLLGIAIVVNIELHKPAEGLDYLKLNMETIRNEEGEIDDVKGYG